MKVQNYTTETPNANCKVFGSNDTNETVNFEVGSLINLASAPGLFAQTGNSTTITATTTESSLVDGGVGSLTVPANGFNVGDSFEVFIGGELSAANNETITFRIKSGSVVLADSGAITMPAVTNKHWFMVITFTVRAIGAAGTASIVSFSQLTYNKNSSNAFEGTTFSTVNNTTFNTTAANTLNITAQWGSNNATNSIFSENLTLTRIY